MILGISGADFYYPLYVFGMVLCVTLHCVMLNGATSTSGATSRSTNLMCTLHPIDVII